MNPKKANWLFLTTLIVEAVFVTAEVIFGNFLHTGVLGSLVASQMVVLLPTIVFFAASRTNPFDFIQTKRIRPTTCLLVIVFTYLCLPLIIVVNAISMLFVDNVVTDLTSQVIALPAASVIFIVGIFGPISEEFVFRGAIYHSYRKTGRIIGGILLSAFLFGITHMNFNQMSYAIVVGIIGAVLIECSGNILCSMIFHMVINLTNTIPMFLFPERYLKSAADTKKGIEALGMTYTEALCMSIGIYAIVAAVTGTLAFCLLCVIAQRENRAEHMKVLWATRKEAMREKLWSWPLVIAIVLCFMYMIFDLMMQHMK